jgi:uncharacterized protein (TIGR00369 family)
MSIGTERLDKMMAGTHQRSPCGTHMALPVAHAYSPGFVQCFHEVDPRFLNSNGVVFGGYLSALLDDVSAHAALTLIPDDKVCATAELSVSYFRPCSPDDGRLVLEGTVVNQSRRSYHIDVTLKRPDGKLIARAHVIHALSDRP